MIRLLFSYDRTRALAALVCFSILTACSGEAAGTISGPQTGTGSDDADPGAAGSYSLSTVNGEAMPFLVDDVVLGPTHIQSWVLGGTLVLNADGSYVAEVLGRWIMNGSVLDRSSSGSGSWKLNGDGTLRLTSSKGGSVTMQRTWYTLTETRKFPVDASREVDLIYVWVLD